MISKSLDLTGQSLWKYPLASDTIDESDTNPFNMVIKKYMNIGEINYTDILSKIKESKKGFIIKNKGEYVDFTSFLYKTYNDGEYETFNSFSEAVDKYFSKNNPSKLDHKLNQNQVKKKKQIAKVDRKEGHLKSQVTGLEKKTEKLLNKATIIEENMDTIDYLIKRFQYYRMHSYTTKEIFEIFVRP